MKKIFIVIHTVIALGLLATGYAYVLNPVNFGIVALAGYAFPFFLLLTLGSIVLAVFTSKRHLAIPFLALVLAYHPVTLYCPFHAEQNVPEDALTIISYNTHYWGTSDALPEENDKGMAVIQYLADSNADIICLQESGINGAPAENVDSILKKKYKYFATNSDTTHTQLTIFSRFPITKTEHLAHSSNGNGSTAYWLNVNGRDLIVINNHLQSTGLSIEQRQEFSEMVHGKNEKKIKQVSKSTFKQLLASSRQRVPQVEAVATFIRRHHHGDSGTPIIVCGDFNDIPQSYTHHVIARNLTDCYQATATGPGYSFSRYAMRVRIDNTLCTSDITPYNFKVDQSITASDHYPIRGQFTF